MSPTERVIKKEDIGYEKNTVQNTPLEFLIFSNVSISFGSYFVTETVHLIHACSIGSQEIRICEN